MAVKSDISVERNVTLLITARVENIPASKAAEIEQAIFDLGETYGIDFNLSKQNVPAPATTG